MYHRLGVILLLFSQWIRRWFTLTDKTSRGVFSKRGMLETRILHERQNPPRFQSGCRPLDADHLFPKVSNRDYKDFHGEREKMNQEVGHNERIFIVHKKVSWQQESNFCQINHLYTSLCFPGCFGVVFSRALCQSSLVVYQTHLRKEGAHEVL